MMNEKPKLYTAKSPQEPICMTHEDALTTLQQGVVEDVHGMMRWGSNYTFLVTIHDECNHFMAIYKPRQGERPLWDFPTGTLCQRETASFVLSEMLNWHLVPPTVLREGPRGIGSVQVFIDHNPNQHYFTFEENQKTQAQRMAVFDAVINNADRKGGHCILDEDDYLWGIDHGLTFHPTPKLRTVIWDFAGEPIPDDLLEDLRMLCIQLEQPEQPDLRQLEQLLTEAELRALRRRIDHLIQTGTYPIPGPGPNRPWPAV